MKKRVIYLAAVCAFLGSGLIAYGQEISGETPDCKIATGTCLEVSYENPLGGDPIIVKIPGKKITQE